MKELENGRLKDKFLFRVCFLFLLLQGAGMSVFAQMPLTIRVVGAKIVETRSGRFESRIEPVSGVKITCVIHQAGKEDIVDGEYRTDDSGEYFFSSASKDFVLTFDGIPHGYEETKIELKKAKLANGGPNGSKLLVVRLVRDDRLQLLGESTVKGKGSDVDGGTVSPIQVGDTLKFDLSGIRIEKEWLPNDARIVLMPYVLNLTRGTTTVLEPTVLDNREFHASQERLYAFDMNANEPIGRLMNRQELNDSLAVIYTPDSATVYKKELLRKLYEEDKKAYRMQTDSVYRRNVLINEMEERDLAKMNRGNSKNRKKKSTASHRSQMVGSSSFVRTNPGEKKDRKGRKGKKELVDSLQRQTLPVVPMDPFVEQFGAVDEFWKRVEMIGKKDTQERMKNPMAIRQKVDYYKDEDKDKNFSEYKQYVCRLASGRDFAVVDLIWQIEDFNGVLRRDTMQVSAGLSRPLEYLQYNFGDAPQITDDRLWPKSQNEELTTEADPIQLNFEQGKANINLGDSLNNANFKQMKEDIATVVNDPKSRILGWTVQGTSSPEGGYNFNKELAGRRLNSLVAMIRAEFPTLHVAPKVSSSIQPWDAVIPLLRKDGQKEIADKVEQLLEPCKEISSEADRLKAQAAKLAEDPELMKLISEKYLPKLRTVQYEVKYKEYRTRRYEEIISEYENDPQSLNEFQYFVLLQNETDSVRHEEIARVGHKKFRNSRYIANALAADLLNRGAANDTILRRFAGERHRYYVGDASMSAYSRVMARNQLVAQLQKGLYTDMKRDKLWNVLVNVPAGQLFADTLGSEAQFLAAVAQAKIGHADDNTLSVIERSSLRNSVLVKILRGKDKEAFDVIRPYTANLLSENEDVRQQADSIYNFAPLDYLVWAICCKRNDDEDACGELLNRAFELDSTLYEVAFNDADLYKYMLEQKEKAPEVRKINVEKILELEDRLDEMKAHAFGLPAGERYNKKEKRTKKDEEMSEEEFARQLREAANRLEYRRSERN